MNNILSELKTTVKNDQKLVIKTETKKINSRSTVVQRFNKPGSYYLSVVDIARHTLSNHSRIIPGKVLSLWNACGDNQTLR